LRYGACGMQGWRNTMEDSHIAHTKLNNDVSLFGVFDGHGGTLLFVIFLIGREVALYVKDKFGDELIKLDSFK
jgi:protein phosphatase 1G